MKNSKLFMLVSAYFAGSAISSMYSKKTDTEIKREMQDAKDEGKSPFKILFGNFVEVHKRLFSDVKENVATEENMEKLNEKKVVFKNLLDEYRKEGEELLEKVKADGKENTLKIMEQLGDIYDEKRTKMEELKKGAPSIAEEYEEKLLSKLKQFKDKVIKK